MNKQLMATVEKERAATGQVGPPPPITRKLIVAMYKKSKLEVRKEKSQIERQRQIEISERTTKSKSRLDFQANLALQASPRRTARARLLPKEDVKPTTPSRCKKSTRLVARVEWRVQCSQRAFQQAQQIYEHQAFNNQHRLRRSLRLLHLVLESRLQAYLRLCRSQRPNSERLRRRLLRQSACQPIPLWQP